MTSSSSTSPLFFSANILRNMVKLRGPSASFNISISSSSEAMRPISSKIDLRSSLLMIPSLSLSMIWKPSFISATCFWENMSKTLLPAFWAFLEDERDPLLGILLDLVETDKNKNLEEQLHRLTRTGQERRKH